MNRWQNFRIPLYLEWPTLYKQTLTVTLLRRGKCAKIYFFVIIILLVRMLCLSCVLLKNRRARHCHHTSSGSFNDTKRFTEPHEGCNALRFSTDFHHNRVARNINNLSLKQTSKFSDSTQMVKSVSKSSGWRLLRSLQDYRYLVKYKRDSTG